MAKQITVVGGNLHRIAAEQLGSALQWWRLAQANGLSDPALQGLTVLTIPSANANLADGLPPQ